MARFTYEANYTGDGKKGCIKDAETDFRAYVDRDDVDRRSVDQVAEAIVVFLNQRADEIPAPTWEDD